MKALAIVGATASGKTALSLEVARRFDCEIICCDSMQIYKYMDIATAKATSEEQCQAPHHMLDLITPDTPYSAADYSTDAQRVAGEITKRGRMPLFCGGTGLYLEAARTGRHGEAPPSDPEYRASLALMSQDEDGRTSLHDMLKECDPESAEAIHKNNVKRVIRALEIYHASGIPKSEWDRRTKNAPPVIDMLIFGIFYHDRELLYRRIDERVDAMVRLGLQKETRFLLENGLLSKDSTAYQAIGYKEYARFINGEISEDEAIADIKLATRHYAKRQLTWFSSKENVIPIYADEGGQLATCAELCDRVQEKIQEFVNKS